MGLDTTHDCWHGAYSAFMRWRIKLAEVAGYGDLRKYDGFFDSLVNTERKPDDVAKSWPNNGDPLQILLTHSDCDGEINWKDAKPIADRLTELLPALRIAGDSWGHLGNYADTTQRFIDGLRVAATKKQNVEFH